MAFPAYTPAQEQEILAHSAACPMAIWVDHHVHPCRVIQCTRFGGPGGALYIPLARACSQCRFNRLGIVIARGKDLVDRMASALGRAYGPDPDKVKVIVQAQMKKGRTGADPSLAGVKELFQAALIEGVRRGLSPADATTILRECNLAADQ